MIFAQMRYARNIDLGLDKEQVVAINGTRARGLGAQWEAMKQRLLEHPGITSATYSHYRPRDTADKVDYEGARDIARFMALVARGLATDTAVPEYAEYERPENLEVRANLRAYLGTIPDYVEPETPGVALSGVARGAPAADAGLEQGDIIVELAGRRIENIYDYTYAIEALRIGEPVSIVVIRDGERLELEITPQSRQ